MRPFWDFVLVILAGAFLLALAVVWRSENAQDIQAEKPDKPFRERCERLGGAYARLHDATSNAWYDEVCMFGEVPERAP